MIIKNMETKKEQDYSLMAAVLENHIAQYQPDNWREPIKSVFPRIFISPDEAQILDIAYQNKSLEATLSEKEKYSEFPVIGDAIQSFFENK